MEIITSGLILLSSRRRIDCIIGLVKTVEWTINILRLSYSDRHEWCLYNSCILAMALVLVLSITIISDAPSCGVTYVSSTNHRLKMDSWSKHKFFSIESIHSLSVLFHNSPMIWTHLYLPKSSMICL